MLPDAPPIDRRRRHLLSAAAAAPAIAGLGGGAIAQTIRPDSQAPRPGPGAPDGDVSGRLAVHVVRARFADLDADTLTKTKLRLLDVVGCAIGGVRGEGAGALARVVAAGDAGPSTVFGTAKRATARDAAMANAILARAFDFEVMHAVVRDVQVPSHHAPTTVMTALATAEQAHADGRAFLTALAVGDDFAARTLAASGLDFDDGWDGVPLHANMAAAAIAARMLKLDARATRHALGLAADQIGGTVQSIWDGASAWKVQQGTAARNGIFSAELAQSGWTGMADPLLAPRGFYSQFTSGCVRPDLLTAGLGREWHGEVYFKPYPSCAANHPAIECAVTLKQRTGIDPEAIAGIRILLAPRLLDLFIAKPLLAGPSPHSQANFSVRFACAAALLNGTLRLEDYAPDRMADPRLTRLIAGTLLAPLPPGAKGVAIEVTLRDGTQQREGLSGKPRHYPEVAGSSRGEVEAKFRQQVAFAGTVPADLADQLVRRIDAVEREPDMADFVALISRATIFPGA